MKNIELQMEVLKLQLQNYANLKRHLNIIQTDKSKYYHTFGSEAERKDDIEKTKESILKIETEIETSRIQLNDFLKELLK